MNRILDDNYAVNVYKVVGEKTMVRNRQLTSGKLVVRILESREWGKFTQGMGMTGYIAT
jgi:hypothetical protein